jgi:hypothetical protein
MAIAAFSARSSYVSVVFRAIPRRAAAEQESEDFLSILCAQIVVAAAAYFILFS